MRVSDLYNELSGLGMDQKVEIDATGLTIGRYYHIDVPLAPSTKEWALEIWTAMQTAPTTGAGGSQ